MAPKKSKKKSDDNPFRPTEISVAEYNDLVEQVRTEFTESECQGELLHAARTDDIDVVRAILQVHTHLHQCQDAHGNTPLHMAAANGHVQVSELLLRLGADPSVTNQAKNTPLHWASSNGQDQTVKLLLKHRDVDVLQQNQFGRSALTEGFSSQNTALVQSLLEHDTAAEERLVGGHSVKAKDDDDEEEDGTSSVSKSVTHNLVFQKTTEVCARELPMAESDKDSILGQVNPSDDTTGLGIWASSLVLAQWLVSQVETGQNRWGSIVELGAGCGVPSLALAGALSRASSSSPSETTTTTTTRQIVATDFNARTVDNLRHNIGLNRQRWGSGAVSVDALQMNWKDTSTWPSNPATVVIGSDLIYQSDMVPLLVQTVSGLLKPQPEDNDDDEAACFLYVARTDGARQGHDEFLQRMEAAGFDRHETAAPTDYTHANPLASQDDDLCYLHFNELQDTKYTLYEFTRTTTRQRANP